MNILQKIISHKKIEIESKSKIISIDKLKGSQRLYSVRDFKSALIGQNIKIIAEIKKRSPSKNKIAVSTNFNPAKIAYSYELNGASAISVLTDQHFFGGSLDFIHEIKEKVKLPILRKDFIISQYQVWESFQAGADAILLIADAIEFSLLSDLYNLATHLGMYTLVEVHSLEKLKEVVNLKPEILGVNCRDLQTMQIDLDWFANILVDLSQLDCLKVAESGIKTMDDLSFIQKLGYNAALIGTSIMQKKDPGVALAKLLIRNPL